MAAPSSVRKEGAMKDLFNDFLDDQGDGDAQVNGNRATDLKLRDYQVKALEQIDAANSAIYVLPTGGGKTVILAFLIKKLVERGERVLIIAHRKEIIGHISRALVFLGVKHGIIKAGLALDLQQQVQIASINTLSRRVASGKMNVPKADAVATLTEPIESPHT
jgi:superfamily II DNA or RNA helicase